VNIHYILPKDTKRIFSSDHVMFEYKIYDNVIKENWNNSLLKFKSSTFLQSYENLTHKTQSKKPMFVYVFNSNNEIVGQLGLTIINTSGLYSSKIFNSFLKPFSNITKRGVWVYGPLIASLNVSDRVLIFEQILRAIDEIAQKYDLVHIDAHTAPLEDLSNVEFCNLFKKYGYEMTDEITHIVDLKKQEIDEIWNNLHKKTRGDVNRAKRRNITGTKLQTLDELKQYSLLNIEWAKSKGLVITEIDYEMKKLWENIQLGLEQVFLAYQNSKLISGVRIGCFNNIAYNNFVINSYNEKTNLGGTLLYWLALEWAKTNNLDFYDFSGGLLINNDDPQIEDYIKNLQFYKSKWGGQPTPYYNLTKIRKSMSYKLYTIFFKILFSYHNFVKIKRS